MRHTVDNDPVGEPIGPPHQLRRPRGGKHRRAEHAPHPAGRTERKFLVMYVDDSWQVIQRNHRTTADLMWIYKTEFTDHTVYDTYEDALERATRLQFGF